MAPKKKTKPPTSVNFDDHVEIVVNHLASIYGLKNVVSAGVFMFSKLSSEQQKQAILEMKHIRHEIIGAFDEIVSLIDSLKNKDKHGRQKSAKDAESGE